MNINLSNIDKSYGDIDTRQIIFKDMSATLKSGEISVVVGRSGVGKSSLLNLISGIDLPDKGSVKAGDHYISELSDAERTLFRRQKIGFIFQFFNLIPVLSVLENITLIAELDNADRDVFLPRAIALLDRVGLTHKKNHFPDTLSGGEQQRVAIVRSLVNDPDIILADEPTGNLDADTGIKVLEMVADLVKTHDKTLVMVTHSPEAVNFADQVYVVRDRLLIAEDKGSVHT